MINRIDKIITSSPKTALEYSDKIVIEAEGLNYQKGIIESRRQKAEILRLLGEYKKAESEINKVLDLTESDEMLERSKSLLVLGIIYYETGKYDLSIETFDEAEKLADDTNVLLRASIATNKAHSFSKRGDYEFAIQEYLSAAKIYEKNHNLKELAISYNNIAAENRTLKLYNKSIEYYKLAVDLNIRINNLFDLARNYANLGVSYQESDSSETALFYYNKSLELSEQLDANLLIAQNYVNMANIYENKGDYKNSLKLFNNSLQICIREDIEFGIMLNYMNIGNSNYLLGNYNEAIKNLDSALTYTIKMKLPKEEAQVYERLTRVYKAKGDYLKAFQTQTIFHELSDSLLTSEKNKQFLELQTKYETEKKEKDILELKSKKDQQQLLIVYLMIAGLCLLIIIIFLIFKRRSAINQKLVAELKAENLQVELNSKNKELTQKALNIAELQENNRKIAEEMKDVLNSPIEEHHQNLENLMRKVASVDESENFWNEFENRFKEVHYDFYSKVIKLYPELTPTELRIISLIRLNFSSKEISEITKRSIRTIENTRKNIRRKMNLTHEDNLYTYILGL